MATGIAKPGEPMSTRCAAKREYPLFSASPQDRSFYRYRFEAEKMFCAFSAKRKAPASFFRRIPASSVRINHTFFSFKSVPKSKETN